MIHHLYVLGTGLMYVLGFTLVPFLLGTPLELFGSSKSKIPFNPGRAWFCGCFFIACLAMVYIVGIMFT